MDRLARAEFAGGLVVALVFAAVVVATYWPVIHDPRDVHWLGPGDAHTETGPNAFFLDYCLHHGELPLWNPLTLCGAPYAANPTRSLFYPPYLLRSLLTVHPTPLRTHVGLLLYAYAHFVLAGIGAFLWARRHGLSTPARFVAAFGYVLSSGFVYRGLGHYGFNVALAWFPFLLLILRRLMDENAWPAKLGWGALGGVILGMVFLSGATQIFILMAFALGAYWLLSRIADLRRILSEWTATGGKALRGDVAALSVLFIITVLVASALLLPAAELAGYSERTRPEGPSLFVRETEDPPWNVFQLLVVYGGSVSVEGIKAAGAGILFLALASIWHPKRRPVLVHAALFFILLDCSLGVPFPCSRLLAWGVPYEMSNPPRGMLLTCFPLGMLAAFGVDAVTARLRTCRVKALRTLYLAIAGATILYVLDACANPHPFLAVSKWVIYFPAMTLAVALLAGWVRRPTIWRWLLPVLVLAETLSWNAFWPLHHFNEENLYAGTIDDLRGPRTFWQDNRRGAERVPNHHVYKLAPAINGYDALHIGRVRQVLCHPDIEEEYRRHVDDYEPMGSQHRGNLFLKRPFWLARQYVRGPLPPKLRPFPATTTVFLPDAENLPVPEVAAESLPVSPVSDEAARLEVAPRDNFPIAIHSEDNPAGDKVAEITLDRFRLRPVHSSLVMHIVGDCYFWIHPFFYDAETGREGIGTTAHFPATDLNGLLYETAMPDMQQADARIKLSIFSKSQRPVEVRDIYARCDPADEDDLIHIQRRTANSVDLEVGPLLRHRILTVIDAYYPGWRAYVDRRRVPIYLANDAFKAIVLPPGTHQVRLVFRPWRVLLGVAVTVGGFLAGAMMFIFSRIRTGCRT
jgi:hypothetical protein